VQNRALVARVARATKPAKPKPVTVPEAKSSETGGVVVSVILKAEDHKRALVAARKCNLTLSRIDQEHSEHDPTAVNIAQALRFDASLSLVSCVPSALCAL